MGNEINAQGAAEAAEITAPADTVAAVDPDVMLPEDYEEGKPYSFEESGTGTDEDPTEIPVSTDESAPVEGEGDGAPTAPAADQPGTGEEGSAGTVDPVPGAEQEAADVGGTNNVYKFTDTVQGMSREVELQMDQIPTMYRKAQTTDFVVRRAYEQDGRARALGYEGVDDMLTKVRASKIETEVAELMDDNVHETIARDVVNRKYPEFSVPTRSQQPVDQQNQPAAPVRNIDNELGELFTAFPALRGQRLPQEVTNAAMGGKSLLNAYQEYLNQHNNAEILRLRKENETLRQNAAAAAKAPVKSTTAGGATDTRSEDIFLKGFNSGY